MKQTATRFALIFSFLFARQILAQDSSQVQRAAGVSFSYDASRSWYRSSSDSWKSDSTFLNASYIFLGQNFHFGPTVDLGRYYSGSYSNTSYGLGAIGKWTFEDLRIAKQTPFAILRTGYGGSIGDSDRKSNTSDIGVSMGYEYFIGNYVSLSNGIKLAKSWSRNRGRSRVDNVKYTQTDSNMKLGLELALSIYL